MRAQGIIVGKLFEIHPLNVSGSNWDVTVEMEGFLTSSEGFSTVERTGRSFEDVSANREHTSG
jgi:hypothetical protein